MFFDSPPDIILFERKDLRPHLKWVYKKWWVMPKLQLLAEESMFSPGTMVEVSSKTDEMETVWVPAMIIKEIEEDDETRKYIVKFCNKPLSWEGSKETFNETVDSQSVRPKQPPFFVEGYKLLDCVEAFRGSRWRKGIVNRFVSQKSYMVSFEDTNKQLRFNHSDLRPPMEWEDGVWKTRESPLTQGSENNMGDSVMNADESVSPVTSSPVIISTPLKYTEAETQRKTFPKKTLQPMRKIQELERYNKEMLDETSEKRKAEQECGVMKRKILDVKHKIMELRRQEAALRKQKDATYEKINQMESRARDLGVELEDVEFEFETLLYKQKKRNGVGGGGISKGSVSKLLFESGRS
ncbi:PREDICTED: DUF724 domain-containing protein 6-like isoform X2 [Camelina sativa]|uniref:DUF724 domain-containing protein 6-like isoform X2 n=1 Tax=Camelina sativa TaxID=90675 RepID=A0ABM0YW60_CAMSA|nr:PREDICTED: DUF724 domain-containing protein 6-like isoform X2 [Camelina sativa]